MSSKEEHMDKHDASDTETMVSRAESEATEMTAVDERESSDTSLEHKKGSRLSLSESLKGRDQLAKNAAWHSDEGPRRSADIDRYLAAESARLSRHTRALIFGTNNTNRLFWKQLNQLSTPVGEMDTGLLRDAIQRHLVQQVKNRIQTLQPELMSPDAGYTESLLEMDNVAEFAQKSVDMHRDAAFAKRLQMLGLVRQDAAQDSQKAANLYSPTCYEHAGHEEGTVEELERVCAADYTPTAHDYVRYDDRVGGSVCEETQLRRKERIMTFIDLRNIGDRRKWIHFFAESHCVVFVADMTLYDGALDVDHNYLGEAVCLFESIALSRWFHQAPVVLVLANEAAFKAKLETSPLRDSWGGYTGSTDEEASQFVKGLFLERAKSRDGVYSSFTDIFDAAAVRDLVDYMVERVL